MKLSPSENLQALGIIAGNGVYPLAMARAARAAGVPRIVVAAFHDETDPALAGLVDQIEWMRVGQLGKMISLFKKAGVPEVVMSGQINPKNLFDLRPDIKALLVLGRLKTRNAESIFGAIGDELGKAGVKLLDATSFMDDFLAQPGLIAGPKLDKRHMEDIRYGFEIAKEVSRLDIGQTVVVKNGTVLAVEAFEGTNVAIKRGGELGRKEATVVKVSKPNQDFRFDVPVVGPVTLQTAAEAKIRVIAVEAGRTLLLEREKIQELATKHGISLFGGDIVAL
jgi:DUF1009 family protein